MGIVTCGGRRYLVDDREAPQGYIQARQIHHPVLAASFCDPGRYTKLPNLCRLIPKIDGILRQHQTHARSLEDETDKPRALLVALYRCARGGCGRSASWPKDTQPRGCYAKILMRKYSVQPKDA